MSRRTRSYEPDGLKAALTLIVGIFLLPITLLVWIFKKK